MRMKHLAMAAGAFLAMVGSGRAQTATRPTLDVQTAGTPADLVSGGDIRLMIADGTLPLKGVRLTVNDKVETMKWTPTPTGLTGVVRHLAAGTNVIVVSAVGYADTRLSVVNHATSGPIFSGPHLNPWICATRVARSPTADVAGTEASGLAVDATGKGCEAPPVRTLFYRTTTRDCSERGDSPSVCFRPYDPRGARPADMATFQRQDGAVRDFIIQVERGSLNRGLYDLAVIYDPTAPASQRLAGWNGKMVWMFGGSGGNQRRQVPPASSWMNEDALRLGFLVGVSNLTDGSRNNNRVLAAETLMMAREYVSDNYGPVRHLIGEGCSAGSMQQNVIASMYPGLIDGALIACAFPDSDTLSLEITDSFLLGHYFDGDAFKTLNARLSPDRVAAMRAAIAGHKDDGTTQGWQRFMPGYLPGVTGDEPSSNGCRLPNRLVYHPERNPAGIRCATPDLSINIWGVDQVTGNARQFRDNGGVQYGLAALLSGAIDGENFVQLNERIGGLDADNRFVTRRSAGDNEAIAIAYRTGLVSDGHGLARTPIIDLRGDENSGVHANWHSFALRARLQQANGNLDNYAIWRVGLPLGGEPWTNPAWKVTGLPLRSLLTMDQWLDAIAADRTRNSLQEKIRRNRPAGLVSFCYLGTDYNNEVTDEAACERDSRLRYFTGIRQVAGAPFTADVLKCALRPLDASEYKGRLSAAHINRLRAVFPNGVCDWSRPGVNQQPARPWPRF